MSSFAGQRVADAILTDPKTSPLSLSVAEAQAALAGDHTHALLIVDDSGKLAAVVERDDLQQVTDPSAAAAQQAAQFGTLKGRTAAADADLQEVWETMRAGGIRRLAVIDASGRLVGLLALKRNGLGFCSDAGVASRRAARGIS